MYLVMVLGIVVLWSFCIRRCRFTVSKALDMSSATVIVLWGGFAWLRPWVMVVFISCRAVVVECLVLKPCWKLWEGMFVVMCGSSIFSSVFAMGERSAIGL